MSVGNTPIEIDISDNHHTTLIGGANGFGKCLRWDTKITIRIPFSDTAQCFFENILNIPTTPVQFDEPIDVTILDIVEFYRSFEDHIGCIDVLTRFGFYPIEWADITAINSETYTVKLTNGNFVCASPDHLLVRNYDWVKVRDLNVGDEIETHSGYFKIESIQKAPHLDTLYDLQVRTVHEFFANGIVSHNSSMIDAMMFGLYGKPYRSVNKNQIINSINKKHCVVEIWFNIDNKKSYYIKRGIKPNIFIIEEDGVEIEEDASVRDFQSYLENDILKISYKTAKQIVALGTAGFTPFMQLKTYERREIIDNLLDLSVFSKMSENNKKLLDDIVDNYNKVSNLIDINKRELDIRETYILENKKDKQKQIDTIQHKIDAADKHIDVALNECAKCKENIQKLESARVDFDKEHLAELLTKKTTTELSIANIQKGIRFFDTHCKCPTCKQGIDEEFLATKIDQYRKEERDAMGVLASVCADIDVIEKTKSRNKKIDDKIYVFNKRLSESEYSIKTLNAQTQKHLDEIEKLKDDRQNIDVSDIELLAAKSKQFNKDKKHLSGKKYCHDIVSKLLKDSGIKTRIINQYIPVINQLINNYLDIMDANYKFELDSEFNEKIMSRGREEFSYMSFSQGEKLRIDLAILFTWRELLKLKNTASFNILIMDEIMDSAADQDGIDAIMKIISDLHDKVFIISHNDKIDTTLFDRNINIIKKGNFSHIEYV